MELHPYIEELRQELLVAAAAGGDEATRLAERLVAPLDASVRLVLLDALAAAAAEITSELAPGSVELRLRGRDPEFVVTPAIEEHADLEPARPPSPADAGVEADDGTTARVTLRLPEALKQKVEDAAARDGASVNAWLVRTLAGALDGGTPPSRPAHRAPSSGQRFTGWSRA